MAQKSERPTVNPLAMVLCDSISREQLSGKLHLNGLFSTIFVAEMPARLTFAAFAAVSGVTRNMTAAHFRVLDSAGELIGHSKLASITAPDDPLQEVMITDHLVELSFPEFGYYFVQLWIQGR